MYTKDQLETFTDMPFYAFVKDENGKYVWCNQHFVKLVKMNSADEIIGKTDFDMPWSEHAKDLIAADKRVLESGKPVSLKEHVVQPGKGVISGYSCKFPADFENKKCVIGVSVVLDDD